jgi:hypothetical protein
MSYGPSILPSLLWSTEHLASTNHDVLHYAIFSSLQLVLLSWAQTPSSAPHPWKPAAHEPPCHSPVYFNL